MYNVERGYTAKFIIIKYAYSDSKTITLILISVRYVLKHTPTHTNAHKFYFDDYLCLLIFYFFWILYEFAI